MHDYFAPIRLPRSTFEELLKRVDDGIAKRAVALVLSEDVAFRSLQALGVESAGLDHIGVDDVDQAIADLDQLVLFACEDAPDNVIFDWARRHDEALLNEAVDRVRFARSNMPHLAELWQAKSFTIVPPLTDFRYEVVRDETGHGTSAVVYISASRITYVGRADPVDSQRLRVRLWPSDIQLLIDQLAHLRDVHLASPPEKGS